MRNKAKRRLYHNIVRRGDSFDPFKTQANAVQDDQPEPISGRRGGYESGEKGGACAVRKRIRLVCGVAMCFGKE